VQGLVLSPTRELAIQTEQVISHIGDFLADGNTNFCATFVGVFFREWRKPRRRRAGASMPMVGRFKSS